ncbi:MAG: P-loop NTPase [Erysipelotrichaceae bacterium]|jgi:Mrp family chromosome partitioning ATPase
MTECNSDCSTCTQNCSQRDLKVKTNQYSNIKKVIGVISGKGGVGKSIVTSLLASAMNFKGYKIGILDADITGPSIPQAFGIDGFLYSDGNNILPLHTENGIKLVSTNLILKEKGQPVLWRGALISTLVKQFYTEVIWGEIDYLFVDLPPGTGDVPLTVFQSLPLDGVIIVSTPQQLVSMIVEKAVRMAQQMNVKIIGLIENMSYVVCDSCGEKVSLFGSSNTEKLAEQYNLQLVAKLPVDPLLAQAVDAGNIEHCSVEALGDLTDILEKL